MKNLFLLLIFFAIVACKATQPADSTSEIIAPQPERIAVISRLITKQTPLPSSLLNAYFIEEQIGDGVLGPSDFFSFYTLSIAPADVPAWRSVLRPIEPQNTPARYAAPKQAASWWLSSSEFSRLEFYSPQLLTGRMNGWLGINPQSGRIYVYAFTM